RTYPRPLGTVVADETRPHAHDPLDLSADREIVPRAPVDQRLAGIVQGTPVPEQAWVRARRRDTAVRAPDVNDAVALETERAHDCLHESLPRHGLHRVTPKLADAPGEGSPRG